MDEELSSKNVIYALSDGGFGGVILGALFLLQRTSMQMSMIISAVKDIDEWITTFFPGKNKIR